MKAVSLSAVALVALLFLSGCCDCDDPEHGHVGPDTDADVEDTGRDADDDDAEADDADAEDADADADDDTDVLEVGPDLDVATDPDASDLDVAEEVSCVEEICNGLDDDCDGLVDEAPRDDCDDACCDDALICRGDRCVANDNPCASNDECWSDAYCEAEVCTPYGTPPEHLTDDTCRREIEIAAVVPTVQCSWSGPAEGFIEPDWVQSMVTPMVIDFDLDDDPSTLRPSIVFSTFPTEERTRPGVLRIIDGATCEDQFSLGGEDDDSVSGRGTPALGDIDGDGRAEVVVPAESGGLTAFRYDSTSGQMQQHWRSRFCDRDDEVDEVSGPNMSAGPSIHDLDGDGSAEIIFGRMVYDRDGCVRTGDASFGDYGGGEIAVVADVDNDGTAELVYGEGIYEWDPEADELVLESYFSADGLSFGQTAVAELGAYPLDAFGGDDMPEVVVIDSGVRVQTLEGDVVFEADLPGTGRGGAPTVADFDGDGRPEFATSGGDFYAVFDLDCAAGGDPSGCGGESRDDGILWWQVTRDSSSTVTGSSVFDFDGDGSAEAVHADECYMRVYDGASGDVIYSVSRPSGTAYENPVIADADGDFHTEIVLSVNDYFYHATVCDEADPLFPAARVERGRGIVVLRDAADRWAASRPVWNQHAYGVTHTGDRGEVPRTSDVANNWEDPELNNFRQNTQGSLDSLGVVDLTVEALGPVGEVRCRDGVVILEALVCNRGLLPMAAGSTVAFTTTTVDGPIVCDARLRNAVSAGGCEPVACAADLGDEPVEIYVAADRDGDVDECWEGNNFAYYGPVNCR